MTRLDTKKLISLAGISGLLFVSVTLPFIFGESLLGVLTKILIFGLFAMSLDLLVGYTALWSFGHATHFGVAAYTTGILISRFEITDFWITAPVALLTVFIYTCIFGFISLRVSGVYFMLVTLALGEITYHILFPLTDWTGGEDGIANIPYPALVESDTGIYYFVLVICLTSYAFFHFLVRSPFGLSLKGIREDEVRMRCLGYNVWLHKYTVFLIAGLFAGISGLLYVHFYGVIVPRDIGVLATGVPWLMLILGGAGTLWGALVGSTIVLSLQYFISTVTPQRWPLIVGIIYIAVVMFARRGTLVWFRELLKRTV
jgi:branched-chain amino acid transport system permease protein